MFSQIEVEKYYQEKNWKETFKKQKQYYPKQHFGESKYREDWYNQQQIIYPRKNILDKIKQKQELYKFRQNGENLSMLKSSIHGSAKKVNMDLYFKPIDEFPAKQEIKYYLRCSLNNSPQKNDNDDEQVEDVNSPKNGFLPPIKSGNGISTPNHYSAKQNKKDYLTKNHSQPNISRSNQQQNSSLTHQQLSPNNKSSHNQSLFLTKQQQQSETKSNYESRNNLGSENSQYYNEEDQSDFQSQRGRLTSQQETSKQKQMSIPKVQIHNIRDNSAPNYRQANMSQFSQENSFQKSDSLAPTPYESGKTKRSLSNFGKAMGEGSEDASLQSGSVRNNTQRDKHKKGQKGKGQKESEPEISIQNLTPIEKFDILMNSLNDISERFVQLVENSNELQMIFENLMTLKINEIAKILVKFFRYCMENLMFGKKNNNKASKSSSISQPSQSKGIGTIDPRIFKKITISQGLVKPLENFFTAELEKVDLHKETAKFRLIWKELYEQHLLVHNLLLEIGGMRRLKVILQSIVDKIQKHYTIRFSSSQFEEMFNFAQAIFQDNPAILSSTLLKYRQQLIKNRGTLNFQRVTFVDLFIIKHFVFIELAKEEYIPWESKVILLQKLEAFRYDNFRDLYNLPETKEITEHLKIFAPQALIEQLPYKSNEAFTAFFNSLAENMLGSGNSLQLMETMSIDGITTSYNNIIMMEHLMKSSITANKDTPQIMRKIIEHKFITLKRNLKIFTNFNSIIIKADEIVNKMNTMNIILLKYLNIPKEEHKLYLEMNLFHQVLVEACSQLDAFSLQDLQYGMKYYKFERKHYFFWIKSIKRVLLEMKYSMGDVQNLAIHLEKIYDDSTI